MKRKKQLAFVRKVWTPEELEVLGRDYHRFGPLELGMRMGRTKASVAQKALRLGLTCPREDRVTSEVIRRQQQEILELRKVLKNNA